MTSAKRLTIPVRMGLLSFAALLLNGAASCVRHEPAEPAAVIQLPSQFSESGVQSLPDRWWTAFNDPALDQLINDALAGNFSLKAAADRLTQARALAVKSGAALLPAVNATANIEGQAFERLKVVTDSSTLAFGLAASYELDIWGKASATRDAAVLDAAASELDLRTAAISLSAEVANAWLRIINQRRLIAQIDKQTETNRQLLSSIESRFRQGLANATDVLQQRQLVESAAGERALAVAQLETLEHSIALLTGRPPKTPAPDSPNGLPALPPLPMTGLPARLIRRRPDVRSAELLVQSADKRAAAAVSAQFPKISLTLSARTTSDFVTDIFRNWFANLIANLTAPVFDGGSIKADIDRAVAVRDAALHQYGQTALTALKETEDALVREKRQSEYLNSLRKQAALAAMTVDRTIAAYKNGATTYVAYLTVQKSLQQTERAVIQAETDMLLYRIALYRALAGGWTTIEADETAEADNNAKANPE
ncbi:MAG: efflux transporter outer membrane subunit [Planctomycetota bacterium]